MALRGAATACTIIARQRGGHLSPILPIQNYLSPRTSPLRAVPKFTTSPGCQTGRYPIRAVQGATVDAISSKKEDEEQSPDNWKIKMLYDGDCPLCMREVNMLRERNKQYRTIKFVDISSEDYSPEENQGLDYETVMGRIHAIMSDGTVVTDVEAFRRLYEQVGLGWVYAITKYEPAATVAGAIYGVWAKYRLQITGRPGLEEILEARRKNKDQVCSDSNTCKT